MVQFTTRPDASETCLPQEWTTIDEVHTEEGGEGDTTFCLSDVSHTVTHLYFPQLDFTQKWPQHGAVRHRFDLSRPVLATAIRIVVESHMQIDELEVYETFKMYASMRPCVFPASAQGVDAVPGEARLRGGELAVKATGDAPHRLC